MISRMHWDKDLIDRMADMSDEELAAYLKRLAKELNEHEADA